MTTHYLDHFFAPRSIAVFGATDNPQSVGAQVFRNLLAGGFDGPILAINPNRKEVQGQPCHASLAATGQQVDLAVVATPAATVPGILQQCGEQGVRGALVLSAGFEDGDGARLEELGRIARRSRMRLLGPNCLGLIVPELGINATFSKNSAQPGPLALVSQSGAICTAILDWAASHKVGFSAVVSLGNAGDVDFGDLLDYLALDARTRSILLYVEGIRNPRRFMSGLRVAARLKPVIVIKAGRHEAGSRAAMSHTGSLVGADDAFDAALRRAGAVRVMTIEQLFAAAQFLAGEQRVKGSRLGIITNAGGPGVLAADRAVDLDLKLADLDPATLKLLDEALPAHWSHGNPVDILGDAGPARYESAVGACLGDRGVDGLLVMLTPQAITEPLAAAQAVARAASGRKKPVLTCWMGGEQVAPAWDFFSAERIPSFPNPEASVEAFAYLATYRKNQQLLLQVPGPLADRSEADVESARLIIEGALAERRKTLNTTESKALLAAFRIPVKQAVEARSANEALVAAASLGFPVAMKISSPDITHKSDAGGVRLNISSPGEVRGAYRGLVEQAQARMPAARIEGVTVEGMFQSPSGRELLVGVARDPVFGPVLSFGAGGTAVEVLRDRAVALPPLNSFIARDLIGRTRVASMLGAFRQMPPIRREALEQVLLRVSEMVCELPQIQELDINPLVADEHGVVALDARVAVEYPEPGMDAYGHMAIHPYPVGLETSFQLADGTDIVLRPIRPEDAEIEQTFIRNLSRQTRYFRFMQAIQELTPQMLVRFTQIDYDREIAFIAVAEKDGKEQEIAVARYITNPDAESCEFAIVVADEWQRKGLGVRLMGVLMETARNRGLTAIEGEVLSENASMLALVRRLGFSVETMPEDHTIKRVKKDLTVVAGPRERGPQLAKT